MNDERGSVSILYDIVVLNTAVSIIIIHTS